MIPLRHDGPRRWPAMVERGIIDQDRRSDPEMRKSGPPRTSGQSPTSQSPVCLTVRSEAWLRLRNGLIELGHPRAEPLSDSLIAADRGQIIVHLGQRSDGDLRHHR